ncbi:sigma-70 family RNA polymerase sigma factor [Streptomyces turgidiscabies]|uniref:Sigma-70 region 2 n=1 Tax=Streptomyces turgidiscabies (strain Car8) TaxID=698760 RepID=L7FGX8_STRT8|nr:MULTISPECIES: sigma-70 family RNA polymerase sigma factor [Streptomyces]ELP70628.1 sigma-70 region 2 [Streptomyces turgidiscabies Car8]MDX3493098.1 sigma-70 family RNA polymerase sigma factor [Streptomyces turgidiscabies]GAQ70395.1 ECF RNA polymerase sigma factor SigK [Streptomyces turgidiscabies]
MPKRDTPPRWDRKMQQRLARGEAAALGELYDRFASLVHGLAHRVLGDEQAADRITREVFAHVWQHPDDYEPKQGPLRSWLASLTHRLAVQRLRQTETAALAHDDPTDPATSSSASTECAGATGSMEELERRVRRASVAARADYIVTSMPAPLRAALELAYFQRRDYRQTAADLGVTEAEARRRLRLGLQLLSTAHDTGTPGAPPEYGGAV